MKFLIRVLLSCALLGSCRTIKHCGKPSCVDTHSNKPCEASQGICIPEGFTNIYHNLSESVQIAIDSGSFAQLSRDDLASIPPMLFLLLPVDRLSTINETEMAYLISNWSDDSALVTHLSKAVPMASFDAFLLQLQNEKLPDSTLDILAREVIQGQQSTNSYFQQLFYTSSPLIAHIPAKYLVDEQNSSSIKLLFLLRNQLRLQTVWDNKSKVLRRIWAHLMIKNDYPQTLAAWSEIDIKDMGQLLIGCTPDELTLLNPLGIKSKLLINYNFNSLQVRTIFNTFYGKKLLNNSDFIELKHIVTQLTPLQLQRFLNNATDYKDITSLPQQRSLAAAKQIIEYIVIENINNGLLHLNTTSWSGKSISILGKFVYALPSSSMVLYRESALPVVELIPLQSQYITRSQALYLTGNGNGISLQDLNIYKSSTLLQALPTSSLMKMKTSDNRLQPEMIAIYHHLLANSGTENIPRFFYLVNNLWDKLGEDNVLQPILKNPNMRNLIGLLPSRFFSLHKKKFSSIISSLKMEYSKEIKNLPANVMVPFLKGGRVHGWTWESLRNPKESFYLFFSGFTCQDIEALETSNFIAVISLYNKERKELGKTFPKNLQHCCAKKLIEYLKIKSELAQEFGGVINLPSLLSEADVIAVGGFILSHLSPSDINHANCRSQILQAIGRLSLPELLIAASSTSFLSIINAHVEGHAVLDIQILFELGNLTLLLPEHFVQKIDANGLKLLLESDYIDKRMCINDGQRHAWAELIKLAFGNPSSWSPHVLATLGDMMLVLQEADFEGINPSSWMDVADLITNQYNEQIEWWKPSPFFEVCLATLSPSQKDIYLSFLKNYVRWHLKAAQLQLDSVLPANKLLKFSIPFKAKENITRPVDFMLNSTNILNSLLKDMHIANKTNALKIQPISVGNFPSSESSNEMDSESTIFEILKPNGSLSTVYSHYSDMTKTTVAPNVISYENNVDFKEEHSAVRGRNAKSDISESFRTKSHNDTSYDVSKDFKDISALETGAAIMKNDSQNYLDPTSLGVKISNNNYSEIYNSTDLESLISEKYTSSVTEPSSTNFDLVAKDNIFESYYTSDPTYGTSSGVIRSKPYFEEGTQSTTSVPQTASDVHSSFMNSSSETPLLEAGSPSDVQSSTASYDIKKTTDKIPDSNVQTMKTQSINENNSKVYITVKHIPIKLLNESSNNVESYSDNRANRSLTSDSGSYHQTSKDNSTVKPTNNFNNNETNHHQEKLGNISLTGITKAHVLNAEGKEVKMGSYVNNVGQGGVKTAVLRSINIPIIQTSKDFEKKDSIQLNGSSEIITEGSYNNEEPLLLDRDSSITNEFPTNRQKRTIASSHSIKISCEAVKVVGLISGITLTIDDIIKMTYNELNDCIEIFGGMNMPETLRVEIWKRMQKDTLHLAGRLMASIPSLNIRNINGDITQPWSLETLSTFGKFSTSHKMMDYVSEQVVKASPPTLSLETVVAMGPLLCHLQDFKLASLIKPEVFLKASKFLGESLPCYKKCLKELVGIALHKDAFGPYFDWTPEDIEDLGVIVTGLKEDDWNSLLAVNNSTLRGFQGHAVRCLSQSFLQNMPLEMMKPLTKIAIHESGMSNLKSDENRELLDPWKPLASQSLFIPEASSGNSAVFNSCCLIFLSLLMFIN